MCRQYSGTSSHGQVSIPNRALSKNFPVSQKPLPRNKNQLNFDPQGYISNLLNYSQQQSFIPSRILHWKSLAVLSKHIGSLSLIPSPTSPIPPLQYKESKYATAETFGTMIMFHNPKWQWWSGVGVVIMTKLLKKISQDWMQHF